MYRFTRLIAAALLLAVLATGCGGAEAEPPSRSGVDLEAGQTIVDIAVANGDFSTLVAALTAADLVDTLSGTGPFTVFAPDNDAFAATLEAAGLTIDELLADKAQLTTILQNHVVAGIVLADQVVALEGDVLISLTGTRLDIGSGPTIGGVAISQTDLLASNGVVHVIDGVLLPPSE